MDGIKYYDHNWNELDPPDESQEIEYAPVVHGHWIKKPLEETIGNGVPIYAMFCSVCGWMGNEIDNYCSNCGARMGDDNG